MQAPDWPEALRRAAVSGSVASLAATAVLAAGGAIEVGRPAAPTNATSQWVWGARARHRDEPSLRHTAVGYLIHHAASVFWATLYEKYVAPRLPAAPVTGAALVSTVAWLVDFHLTPQRLRPGFEHRLSLASLIGAYAAFGAGLVAGHRLEGLSAGRSPHRRARTRSPARPRNPRA